MIYIYIYKYAHIICVYIYIEREMHSAGTSININSMISRSCARRPWGAPERARRCGRRWTAPPDL